MKPIIGAFHGNGILTEIVVKHNKIPEKQGFAMPFYIFKKRDFLADIAIFLTNHLITNNKTAFLYAGISYFDNKDFYRFVDSVLVK